MPKKSSPSGLVKFWKHLSFGQQIFVLLFILAVLTLPFVIKQSLESRENRSRASESIPRPRELVNNGSFETDVDKDGIPDGWTWFRKTIGKNNGQVCDTAQTGKCSFTIKGGDGNKTLTQDINFAGNANTQLTFNAWLKTNNIESNNVEVGMIFLDQKGNEVGSIADIDRRGKHEFEATNPNNIAQNGIGKFSTIRIYIKYKRDQDGGRVWFDNISLKASRTLPTPPPPSPSPSPSPVPTRSPLGSPVFFPTSKPGIPIPSTQPPTY